MEHPLVVVGLTLAALLVLYIIAAAVISGGNLGKFFSAKKVFLRYCSDAKFAEQIDKLTQAAEPVAAKPKPTKPDGTPLRLLNLLQREGRLVDFLLEDIDSYSDDQLGAGVRDIHSKCRNALKEHLELTPVLDKNEGDNVTIVAGFDPSAIQLTGNVAGQPPFQGTLQHHGWQVKKILVNKPGEGVDELVIQPAEVEIT